MPPLYGRQKQSGRPEDMGAGVAAGQVAAPVQPQQRQQGPGWVDFGRLLSANRAGSERMARSLTDTVRGEGGAVDDAIQQAGQTYTNALGQKTTQYDPNSVKTVAEAEAKTQGSFQGPKSWEEAGVDTVGLAGKAAAASDKAKSLTSGYGRAALLRAQVQGPYSAGMSGLDAALAGGAGGSAFQETANMYGGLSAKLQAARGGAGAAYEQAAATDAANRAKYGARAGEIKAGIAAQQRADLERQQQAEADAAAGGGTYRPGANAKSKAGEKSGRAKPETGTNQTGRVGVGSGLTEAEARRLGIGIHRNLGGWP